MSFGKGMESRMKSKYIQGGSGNNLNGFAPEFVANVDVTPHLPSGTLYVKGGDGRMMRDLFSEQGDSLFSVNVFVGFSENGVEGFGWR